MDVCCKGSINRIGVCDKESAVVGNTKVAKNTADSYYPQLKVNGLEKMSDANNPLPHPSSITDPTHLLSDLAQRMYCSMDRIDHRIIESFKRWSSLILPITPSDLLVNIMRSSRIITFLMGKIKYAGVCWQTIVGVLGNFCVANPHDCLPTAKSK
jgi:hypothetical protein